jgi:acyl dehydratase
MPTVISIDDLQHRVGDQLGHSAWVTVTQEQVNLFADATGDHQWIHVDPERAKTGPFGAPIAHGYLTLSLLPGLLDEVLAVSGTTMAVKYGFPPRSRWARRSAWGPP